jgi:hypothetical protein
MSLTFEVTWVELKRIRLQKTKQLQYVDLEDRYCVMLVDGSLLLHSIFMKESTEAADFEANFKNTGNTVLEQRDSDGSPIVRGKTTRTGWHYEPRSLDFTTSKADSLYNKKHDGNTIEGGTDYNDATMAFFDSSGSALVKQVSESVSEFQTRLDGACVRTQIDWWAKYEMDIIGATVSVLNPPGGNSRGYAWVIVAPDVPAQFGGSVPFMAGGWNLRHFGGQGSGTTFLDGRGVKTFPYDPVYASNKIRVVVKHEPGAKIEMQFVAEHFRA